MGALAVNYRVHQHEVPCGGDLGGQCRPEQVVPAQGVKEEPERGAVDHDARRADLQKALAVEGRQWVQGRAHLELGKLSLKEGARAAATEHFRNAARLCESDNDEVFAEEARRLLK